MNVEEVHKAHETATAILELRLLGYTFQLDGDKVHYKLDGDLQNPEQANKLFQVLKNDKEGVVRFFRRIGEPLDLTEALYNAATKAYTAGDLPRFARLMAAAMIECGETDPYIPWGEWVASFDSCEAK